MRFHYSHLQDFLSKYPIEKSIAANKLESFHAACTELLQTDKNESEEHQKNKIRDFLKTCYNYECNTKERIDLSIVHNGCIKVLFECKKLANKKHDNKSALPKDTSTLESLALYQSILYYLRESQTHNNNNISMIVLCNLHTFYLIDAKEYLQFARDKNIMQAFKNCDYNEGNDTSTQRFYTDIAKILKNLDSEMRFTYFDIQDALEQPQMLRLIYCALSPEVLIRQTRYIDANTLNQGFYNELLYILGLQEVTKNGKTLIIHNADYENSLFDSIAKTFSLNKHNDFETIFSLLITWNNRLLFLRLLESMLLHIEHTKNAFLSIDSIPDFSTLSTLFFSVLAQKNEKRSQVPTAFKDIPYLNSSLFDKTIQELENNKDIGLLQSKELRLKIYPHSILYTNKIYQQRLQREKSLPLLEYILSFLHAYNFTTKDATTTQNKDTLINAAILGLVFEKLNGYKEGSFYTPSFITSYMCESTLEKAIIEKFNTAKNWDCKSLESLQIKLDKITNIPDDYKDVNGIFDSIRICDPSVGSGHFLVSMLNAMIKLKYDLGILCWKDNYDNEEKATYHRLKDIIITLENDSLILYDSHNKPIHYTHPAHEGIESHKIQKALFHTKRTLIESCLFGVDINPNSCEITKLRLWIELLKHTYYKDLQNKYLETLPNIDINIKCGNSLVSRFSLQDSLKHIPNIKQQIEKYKQLVSNYKKADQSPLNTSKKDIESQIEAIKQTFTLILKDPETKKVLEKAIESHIKNYGTALLDDKSLLEGLSYTPSLFESKTLNEKEVEEAYQSYGKIVALRKKLDFTLSGEGYKSAFEWRFAFPEVLEIADKNKSKQAGDFLGFDIVIGNPPYIRQEEIKHLKPQLQKAFSIYTGTSDIYTYFYELGYKILAPNGILSFITSNKYCRAGYGQKLREFLLTHTSLLSYTELNGIKVFDSASVDTSILSFAKSKPSKNATFIYSHPKGYEPKSHAPLQDSINPQSFLQSALSAESFIFLNQAEAKLKAKIESRGTPLKEWDISIYRGILTGYNEAFIIDSTKRDEILESCDDSTKSRKPFLAFMYDSNLASRASTPKLKDGFYMLTERERTRQLIKPILRGKDIKRYSYEWAGLYIIGTFPALKLDIDDYPAVKKHLESYRPRIDQSGEQGCRKKTSNKWFETQDQIAYYKEFNKPKIVYSEIVREPQFYLDNGEFKFGSFYAEATSFVLSAKDSKDCEIAATCKDSKNAKDSHKKPNLHYLLGILHSKLATFAFKSFYAGGGLGESGYRYKKAFLENLPIPRIDSAKEAEFVKIVKQIIALRQNEMSHRGRQDFCDKNGALQGECKELPKAVMTKREPQESPFLANKPTPLQELESKLDSMVCNLYGLNETEAQTVLSLSLSLVTALLLIASIESKLVALTLLLLDNFEKELQEAFRFCENLKLPRVQNAGKISWQRVTQEPSFVLESDYYLLDSMAFLTHYSLEELCYLLGFLNSKAIFYYFKQIGHLYADKGFLLSNQYVERFPIPKAQPNNAEHAKVIQLVKQILESKKADSKADTSALEKRLDSLIYALYGLDEKEIMLIESSCNERERERVEVVENLYHLLESFIVDSSAQHKGGYQGKIIYPCIMAQESCFTYEERGFFAPAPANIISGDETSMKYLTGLLNSKCLYFAMRKFYMGGGIQGELKTNNLLKIPIPRIDSNNQKIADEIVRLVEKILESKNRECHALPCKVYNNDKADSKANTTELESKIDSLVYKLYNLTEAEINIIEK